MKNSPPDGVAGKNANFKDLTPGWDFYAQCLVIAAAFANVSVFYSFYHYLGNLDIPVAWRGFLVGLEPMAAFVLRLFVLPWISLRNAYTVTAVSLVLLIGVSWSYLAATTVPALVVLRVIHGAAFVLLTSSVVALAVAFIPPQESGRAFSTLSIATMVPYALIPPLSERVLPWVRNEAVIYAGVSVFAVAALLLIAALRPRITAAVAGMDAALLRRPRRDELRENFRHPPVILFMGVIFLVYVVHATIFYFLKDLTLETRAGDVGWFFSVAMAAMIAVRVAGTALFDRIDKVAALRLFLAGLAACVVFLPHAPPGAGYYLAAIVYGVAVGVILPLLNALLFLSSPPPLRGFNSNMGLFIMDGAYFLTPYAWGILIAAGAGFAFIFYAAGILAGLALLTTAGRATGAATGKGT
ncbi:MAG TPA: MFS transporter [Syntrophales bacterium]|nr:MFS transporter [Syntrophales bacterium]